MPSRRQQIAMTDDERSAFLDEQRVLNVATIGPTGHPHLVAMWYAILDGHPSFWTFGKSQKIVNLRRDPRITALVESGDSYGELRGVELVGTARIVEDFDEIVAIGRAVAAKYQGTEVASSPEVLAFLEGQARKRVGVVIDVDRVVSWDHTKLAGSY
jgi:PPOX class probable F420-dependent enzyme